MKIQLANRTYYQEGCCGECAFWQFQQISRWEIKSECLLTLPFQCKKGWKKKLFNDKIFKL